MRCGICISGLITNARNVGNNEHEKCLRIFKDAFYNKVINSKGELTIDLFCHSYTTCETDKITEILEPTAYLYEDYQEFPDIDSSNKFKTDYAKYSSAYSVKQSVKLLTDYSTKHNLTYDFVILTRYNNILHKNTFIDLSTLDTSKFYVPSYITGRQNSMPRVLDFFFITSVQYAVKYTELFNQLDKYHKDDRTFLLLSNNKRWDNHTLKHAFLTDNEFPIALLDFNYCRNVINYLVIRRFSKKRQTEYTDLMNE